MFLSRLKGKSDIPPGEVARFEQEMAWENIGSEMLISAMLFCNYFLTFVWVAWTEGVGAVLIDILPWIDPLVFVIFILAPPVVAMACTLYARRKKKGITTLFIHRLNLFLLIFGACLPSILVYDHMYYEMVILLVSVLVTQVPTVSLALYGTAMLVLLLGGGWGDAWYSPTSLETGDLVITTILGQVMVRFRYSDRVRNYLTTTALESQRNQLKEMNQELVKANVYLNNLSRLDGLTGLNNRRAFDDMLDREWRRAMRMGGSLGLLMVDIDFFKPFNDTYGHQAGDHCLKRVAEALQKGARRGGDLVARYGGEEFAVLLPRANEVSLRATAELLRKNVAELGILHETPDWGHVSISLGGAVVRPQAGGGMESLVARADEALYAAKSRGRNRVVIEV